MPDEDKKIAVAVQFWILEFDDEKDLQIISKYQSQWENNLTEYIITTIAKNKVIERCHLEPHISQVCAVMSFAFCFRQKCVGPPSPRPPPPRPPVKTPPKPPDKKQKKKKKTEDEYVSWCITLQLQNIPQREALRKEVIVSEFVHTGVWNLRIIVSEKYK